MMQARSATLLHRSLTNKFPVRWLASGNTSGRTADPAEHAVEHEEVYPSDAYADQKKREEASKSEETTEDKNPYVSPKSPIQSSPKLESDPIGPQIDPISQQKRRVAEKIDGFACGAINGGGEIDREEQRKDDVEYFKHRKASPLSEVEFEDTRKPITRATDTVAKEKDATGWLPEQLDTAEESLGRASEIFRMNAARGDPDSPHGRILRQLRGEDW